MDDKTLKEYTKIVIGLILLYPAKNQIKNSGSSIDLIIGLLILALSAFLIIRGLRRIKKN